MSRPIALVVGLGVVVATLTPVCRDPLKEDSYPLSTYPMFARALSKRRIVFAEGTNRTQSVRLPPAMVANDEPMQAQRMLRMAARGGEAALSKLCERVAERVAASAALAEIRRVRIVSGLFDPIRYFEVNASPEQRDVLHECRVRRSR